MRRHMAGDGARKYVVVCVCAFGGRGGINYKRLLKFLKSYPFSWLRPCTPTCIGVKLKQDKHTQKQKFYVNAFLKDYSCPDLWIDNFFFLLYILTKYFIDVIWTNCFSLERWENINWFSQLCNLLHCAILRYNNTATVMKRTSFKSFYFSSEIEI